MKKSLIMCTAILAGLWALMGCSPTKENTRVQAVQKAGKIILGTSADYPPYEFHAQIDGEDTIVGFDVALANEIAKDLGVTLEIKDMDFDGLLAALASGNVDFVIAGMTPSEERRMNVDFSDIYYFAEHGVVIRTADESLYSVAPDSLKDRMIGAQRGAIQVSLAKTRIKGVAEAEAENPHPQVKELGKLPDLIMELKNKKIDAVVVELPVARSYFKANSDLVLASYTFLDDDGGSAVAVKKGEKALVEAINKTILRLQDEGRIEAFVAEASELVEY